MSYQIPVSPTEFIANPGTKAAPLYVGMAPCIAYFDARTISDTQKDVLAWNFGDGNDPHIDPSTGSTVNANNALTAQVVAHWYLNPGTYAGSCVVDGKTYPFVVEVAKDTRSQIAINAANQTQFLKLAAESNVHITVATGTTVLLNNCVQLGSNTVITGTGATINMTGAGELGFAGTVGTTADILISGFTFEGATAQIARLRGKRIGIINSIFGNIDRGIEVEPNTLPTDTDCILIQNNKQTGTCLSQVIYIGGGTRVIELFNTSTNSQNESTVRADGIVGLVGWTEEYCDYSQPGYAKAAVTRRCGTDGVQAHCKISRSDNSFNVGDGNPNSMPGVRITNTCSRNNLMDFSGTEGTFRIMPGTMGLTARANKILRSNGPAITMAPSVDAPTTGIQLIDNAATGTAVRLLSEAVPSTVLTVSTGNTVNGVPTNS
jgi:hypothetical protein